MLRFLSFWICFLLFMSNSFAQDWHLSDYSTNQIHLSPALTGFTEGNDRLVATYRNQWWYLLGKSSYETKAVAYDRRWCGDIPIATGLRIVRDQAGSTAFTRQQAHLTTALYQSVSKNSYLTTGLEIGLIQHKIDFNSLSFDSQFNGEDYLSTSDNQEDFLADNFLLWDISAAVALVGVREARDYSIGVAFHHINRPNYAFRDAPTPIESRIPLKLTVHANMHVPIGGQRARWGWQPRFIFQMQGNQWQTLAGADVDVFLDKNRTFPVSLGIAWRNGGHFDQLLPHHDALVASLRMRFDRTILGLSYDMNISNLRNASKGLGAFELTLAHQFSADMRNCIECRFKRWLHQKTF